MVEYTSKEYKETMQEVMLELKLSTSKFLKKFKEECKNSKLNPVEIPITVSLRGEHRELEIDLFGIGDKAQRIQTKGNGVHEYKNALAASPNRASFGAFQASSAAKPLAFLDVSR